MDRHPRQRWALDQRAVVGAVYVVTMFTSILDSTVVNVALPTMARDFHVGTSSIEWVVTGYLLSLAAFIPASGWLGDRIGTKRVFLAALLLFTVASALCGQAHSVTELVVFRVLQGAGGGMLMPVGTAMLFRAFPPHQRARATSILIIPTVVAPASGPVLGGLLVDTLSWRWVFYVNVPIGLAALVFGAVYLHEHREPPRGRFDLGGFVLAGVGLPLVLYAISQAPVVGWGAPEVIGTLLGGLACFAALVPWELRRHDPMLRLGLLGDRLFALCNLTGVFAYASFLGILFVLPLFFQEGRGTSALVSGLTTFPEAVGVAVSSQLVARVYPRLGPRRLMAGGLVGVAVGMVALALVGHGTSLWWVRLIVFAMGGSMSFVFVSLQTATFARVTPADTGQASAIYNTQRQVASAVGVAVLASVLTAVTPKVGTGSASTGPADLAGFHAAFAAAAGLAVVGALVALWVRDADASGTMRSGPGRDSGSGAGGDDGQGAAGPADVPVGVVGQGDVPDLDGPALPDGGGHGGEGAVAHRPEVAGVQLDAHHLVAGGH